MALLNWHDLLGDDVSVVYSSLEVDHVPEVGDGELALLRVGDHGIDVAWSDDDEKFVVTMYKGRYDNPVQSAICDRYSEVVEAVKLFYEAGCNTSRQSA